MARRRYTPKLKAQVVLEVARTPTACSANTSPRAPISPPTHRPTSMPSPGNSLTGGKTPGQVAKAYGVHPNSVQLWKRRFVERAPEVFAGDTAVNEYERRIRDLEQLLGKKEVEIARLKDFLGRSG